MIEAVGDAVIVKIQYDNKMRGLFVPDQAKQYSGRFKGVVESVGPACPYRELKKGDEIAFLRHEGYRIKKGVKEFFVLNPRWIVGKIICKLKEINWEGLLKV